MVGAARRGRPTSAAHPSSGAGSSLLGAGSGSVAEATGASCSAAAAGSGAGSGSGCGSARCSPRARGRARAVAPALRRSRWSARPPPRAGRRAGSGSAATRASATAAAASGADRRFRRVDWSLGLWLRRCGGLAGRLGLRLGRGGRGLRLGGDGRRRRGGLGRGRRGLRRCGGLARRLGLRLGRGGGDRRGVRFGRGGSFCRGLDLWLGRDGGLGGRRRFLLGLDRRVCRDGLVVRGLGCRSLLGVGRRRALGRLLGLPARRFRRSAAAARRGRCRRLGLRWTAGEPRGAGRAAAGRRRLDPEQRGDLRHGAGHALHHRPQLVGDGLGRRRRRHHGVDGGEGERLDQGGPAVARRVRSQGSGAGLGQPAGQLGREAHAGLRRAGGEAQRSDHTSDVERGGDVGQPLLVLLVLAPVERLAQLGRQLPGGVVASDHRVGSRRHHGAQVAQVELVDHRLGRVGPVEPIGHTDPGEQVLRQRLDAGRLDRRLALGRQRDVLVLDRLPHAREAGAEELVGDRLLLLGERRHQRLPVDAARLQALGLGALRDFGHGRERRPRRAAGGR